MTYLGWKNYQTWNVNLWIVNDERFYHVARACRDYSQFKKQMDDLGIDHTPDGVRWDDTGIDTEGLDNTIKECE